MDIKWLAPRSVFYSLYYDGSLLDYGPSSRGENLKCHAQTSSTRRLLWRMLTISDGLAPLESVYPTYEYLNLTKENERLENQKFTRISLRTSIDEQIQKNIYKNIKFQNSSSRQVLKGTTRVYYFSITSSDLAALSTLSSFHLSTSFPRHKSPLHYSKQTRAFPSQ